jgi:hypothetical protein
MLIIIAIAVFIVVALGFFVQYPRLRQYPAATPRLRRKPAYSCSTVMPHPTTKLRRFASAATMEVTIRIEP